MRLFPIAAMPVGLLLIGALVAHFGAGAVAEGLYAVGWRGLATIGLIHLGLIALMGLAWRLLLPGSSLSAAVWGRLVRDSASEVLPLSQVGGYIAGARAITIAELSGSAATASTIVDVSLEFVAQIAYTALGLVWLLHLEPATEVVAPVVAGLVAAGLLAAGLLVAQRRGLGLFDRLVRAASRGWADRTAAGAATVSAAIVGIHARPARLFAGVGLHLACWVAGTIEAWLALRLAGAPIGFGAALVIESLLCAVRSAAFAVPNAMGVQEGAYVLLGAGFGVTPEAALALSLLKRTRDLAIGLPTLAAWQCIEGDRLWRHFALPRPIVVAARAETEPHSG